MSSKIKILRTELLSDDWGILKKTYFKFRRKDGTWQNQHCETYDKGDGAVILLYNLKQETVVLIKQFRFPTFVSGFNQGFLIEAAAGLLQGSSPEKRIIMETEEETGYRVQHLRKIFDAFMSPGSVTEKIHFFIGEYSPNGKVSQGGGLIEEGEDIEVLEWPFSFALNAIDQGTIKDAKTIMLLQYAALHIFKKPHNKPNVPNTAVQTEET